LKELQHKNINYVVYEIVISVGDLCYFSLI